MADRCVVRWVAVADAYGIKTLWWTKSLYTCHAQSATSDAGCRSIPASSHTVIIREMWRSLIFHTQSVIGHAWLWLNVVAVVFLVVVVVVLCLFARPCLPTCPSSSHMAHCVTWPDELVFTCHLQVPVILLPRSCCNCAGHVTTTFSRYMAVCRTRVVTRGRCRIWQTICLHDKDTNVHFPEPSHE